MIEFIESHLGTITLLLALTTVWLAVSTRQAAVASKNIFALEARPFLVFSKPIFRIFIKARKETPDQIERQILKLGIEFKNPSKVPLKYQICTMRITFDEHTVEEPKFTTLGGIIYPGDFGIFWFGDLQYKNAFEAPKGGIIEYELEYFSTDFPKKYRKVEKMRYSLNSFEPYICDWSYIEDSVEEPI